MESPQDAVANCALGRQARDYALNRSRVGLRCYRNFASNVRGEMPVCRFRLHGGNILAMPFTGHQFVLVVRFSTYLL
jgi:hypothetical protein